MGAIISGGDDTPLACSMVAELSRLVRVGHQPLENSDSEDERKDRPHRGYPILRVAPNIRRNVGAWRDTSPVFDRSSKNYVSSNRVYRFARRAGACRCGARLAMSDPRKLFLAVPIMRSNMCGVTELA